MYYNTNDESGTQLTNSRRTALTQEEIILEFFQNNPNLNLSPFDIYESCTDINAPITSIRRAITDLTLQGKLIKTNTMVLGPYRKNVHTWRLNNE